MDGNVISSLATAQNDLQVVKGRSLIRLEQFDRTKTYPERIRPKNFAVFVVRHFLKHEDFPLIESKSLRL